MNNTPLVPKKPGPLRVLTLGRISTRHQDMKSIEAQHAEVSRTLKTMYDGDIDLTKLGEQASGEAVFRETFVEAVDLIETREFDLAILFDLSKASRSPQFMWLFINTCMDHDTRFISIGDGIDTADPSWQTSAGAAALIHGTHIQHTRHRVIAKAIDAFHHGGMVTKVIFGYRKLSKEEAKSGEFGPPGLRMAKAPEVTEIIREMKDLILSGRTYEEVAVHLLEKEVSAGAYSLKPWTGKKVITFLRNPLLHGERVFGHHQTIRSQATGQKRRKIRPEPERRVYPELAHLSPEEHSHLIDDMDRRIAKHPRKARAKEGSKGRARTRTFFPGQLMTCVVCESPFYWRGSGGLQCSNRGDPAEGQCWNHVQVNAAVARARIRDVLLGLVADRPDVGEILVDAACREYAKLGNLQGRESTRRRAQKASLETAMKNLAATAKLTGPSETLVSELRQTEADLNRVTRELAQSDANHSAGPAPITPETVRERLPELLDHLLANSYEFSSLLRQVISRFVILPFQAVDTGRPVARAQVTFSFAALLAGRKVPKDALQPGDFSIVLDLFDPPASVRCLNEAVRIRRQCPTWSAEKVAAAIQEATGQKVERWAVHGAWKLQRVLEEKGVDQPYVPTTDPNTVSRWRTTNSHKARWNQT
ncbi:MAG: recombinase family protein [Planctomycetota bacterium]